MDEKGVSESEIKKCLNQIKNDLWMLSQGVDINASQERILDYYNNAQHRIIKILALPLLKSLSNIDFQSIFSTIAKDLVSDDNEIQLNTLKLLYQMPPNLALEILRSNEKDFLKILDNSEFHYERLTVLHDFLIKAYLTNYAMDHSSDDCRGQVEDFYIKLAESLFSHNNNNATSAQQQQPKEGSAGAPNNSVKNIQNSYRDIMRDSIEIFLSLYQQYLNCVTEFNSIDHFFDGNGSIQKLLKPLIIKVTNFFIPRLDSLLKKISSFEIRLQSHLLSFPVLVLETAFQFYTEQAHYNFDNFSCAFISEQYLFQKVINQEQQQTKLVPQINQKKETTTNNNKEPSPTKIENNNNKNNNNLLYIDLRDIYIKLLEQYLVGQILVSTYEYDILSEVCSNIFRCLALPIKFQSLLNQQRRNQIIWQIFEIFLTITHRKNVIKEELNVILLNLATQATTLNPTYKICISFKLLEIVSKNIPYQFNRFFLMFVLFYNIIESSLKLLTLNKQSCIFSLFNLPWFLQLIKQQDTADGGNSSNDQLNPDSTEQNPLDSLLKQQQQQQQQQSQSQQQQQSQQQINQQSGNGILCLKEELLTSLIISAIYAKINIQHNQYMEQIILEVLDVSHRMINWKYKEQASLNDQFNKTINFAIDIFLVLLEEAIQMVDTQQINLRLIELIKRINQNEIHFLPKLKLIYIICKHYDQSSLVMELNYSSLLGDFRAFMIPSYQNSIFSIKDQYTSSIQNSGSQLLEIISYLSKVEQIFICLYYLAIKFSSGSHDSQNSLENQILMLLQDYKQYLSELKKMNKMVFHDLIASLLQYTDFFQSLISKRELAQDIETYSIDKHFLDLQALSDRINQRNLNNFEPRELLQIAFNIFAQGVCKQQVIFNNDNVQSDNAIKNYRALFLHLQSSDNQNHHLNHTSQSLKGPTLITGISDVLQVYASHATFVYKSLISINLKLVSMVSFKLENVRIRILCGQGSDIFPSSINQKEKVIDEIIPHGIKTMNFCLKIEEVETLYVSFEISIGEGGSGEDQSYSSQINIRTLSYKVGLIDFLLPNFINILSKYFFRQMQAEIINTYSLQCRFNGKFIDFWHNVKKKQLSCVILQQDNYANYLQLYQSVGSAGTSQGDSSGHKKEHGSLNQFETMEKITIGLLAYTWDGVQLAINIQGIQPGLKASEDLVKKNNFNNNTNNTNNIISNNIVNVEIKCSKYSLLEQIKDDIDNFLNEISEGSLNQL